MIPGDAAVAPAPIRDASSSTTGTPAIASEQAQAQPVRPPPMTTTALSPAPRQRGCDGLLLLGTRSSQNGACVTTGGRYSTPPRSSHLLRPIGANASETAA